MIFERLETELERLVDELEAEAEVPDALLNIHFQNYQPVRNGSPSPPIDAHHLDGITLRSHAP